jgi:hypothetical protein
MPSLDSSSESTMKKPTTTTKKNHPPTEIHTSHDDQSSQNSLEQHEKTMRPSLENNSQVKSVITLGTGEQSDEGKINAMVMGNDEDETDSFLFFDQEHEAEEDQKETQMMESMKEFVRKNSEATFKYQASSQEHIPVFKGDELAVLPEESSIASSIVSKRENNNQKTPLNNEVLQANIEKRGPEDNSMSLQKQKSSTSNHSPAVIDPIATTTTPATVQAAIVDDISRLKGLLTEDGMGRVKRISTDFMNNVFQAAFNSAPSSPLLHQTLKNEFYEQETVGKQEKDTQQLKNEQDDDLEITYQLEKETQETLRQYIEQQESSDTPEKQSKPVHQANEDNYHEEEEQPFLYHHDEAMNSGDELLYDDKNEQIISSTTKKVAPLRPVTTGSNQTKKPAPSSSSTRPISASKQGVTTTTITATTSAPMATAERAKSAPSTNDPKTVKPKPKASADPLLAGLEQYTGPPPSLQQKQHQQQQQSKPKERVSSSHQKTSQPSSSAVSQLRSAVASSRNTGTIHNQQQQAQMKQYDREQLQKMKLKELIMSKPNNPIRFDSHECRIVLTETCIHRKPFPACSSSFCKEAYNKFQWLKLILKKTELAIELMNSAVLLWRKKLQSSLDNALDALELEQEEEVSKK